MAKLPGGNDEGEGEGESFKLGISEFGVEETFAYIVN